MLTNNYIIGILFIYIFNTKISHKIPLLKRKYLILISQKLNLLQNIYNIKSI